MKFPELEVQSDRKKFIVSINSFITSKVEYIEEFSKELQSINNVEFNFLVTGKGNN